MKSNPFLSDTFTDTWINHFNENKKSHQFAEFNNLRFVKNKKSVVHTNVGQTHTKGIFYTANKQNTSSKKNVYLIYDVPKYYNINTQNSLKTICCKQYPGFLINLSEYKDLNSYLLSKFKKSSRYKLKKYKKRLESCFTISQKSFFGDITKTEYDYIFKCFKKLLEKRFEEKQTVNNNLDPKEWGFYFDVTYKLILEKKASLFVIYNEKKPIAITLNYLSDSIIFDAITVFDIDYSKFHLGSINIMKLIEWVIDNNYKKLDFSKGYFDYKTRWSDEKYDFEYHIHYNPKSILATCIAQSIKYKLILKQFLREKNVNDKLHQITYKLKNGKKVERSTYKITTLLNNTISDNYLPINFDDAKYKFLTPAVYEFLYLTIEHLHSIKLYRTKNHPKKYLIKGLNKSAEILITNS